MWHTCFASGPDQVDTDSDGKVKTIRSRLILGSELELPSNCLGHGCIDHFHHSTSGDIILPCNTVAADREWLASEGKVHPHAFRGASSLKDPISLPYEMDAEDWDPYLQPINPTEVIGPLAPGIAESELVSRFCIVVFSVSEVVAGCFPLLALHEQLQKHRANTFNLDDEKHRGELVMIEIDVANS